MPNDRWFRWYFNTRWRRRIVSIAAPYPSINGSGDRSGDIVLWCSMPSALYPKLVFLRDEPGFLRESM